MKKLAFFVEGQTEMFFVERILKEIASANQLVVNTLNCTGRMGKRNFTAINFSTVSNTTKYYILIYDCHGEGQVKSDMIDQAPTLARQSFDKIIGLRDVYPTFTYSDVHKLQGMINIFPASSVVPCEVVLGVMETEAWFLAEESHYSRVDSRLTPAIASAVAGVDVSSASTESILAPADTLDKIYKTVGHSYKKTRSQLNTILSALDYTNLYVNVRQRVSSLNMFFNSFENYFA